MNLLALALAMGAFAAPPNSPAQPAAASECSDTLDNDSDGLIDLSDAGCLFDSLRDDETGELVVNSTLDKIDADTGDPACETDVAGECTVRAGIMQANATPGEQGLQVPAGVFELTVGRVGQSLTAADGDLDITDDLVLIGAGAESTRIGGDTGLFSDRVLEILPATQVTISGVTVQKGRAPSSSDPHVGRGGGVFNAGTLLLTNSTVSWSEAMLARIIHEAPTAAAHLRTLAGEIGVRLLDVPPGTSPRANTDFSCQSTNLHRLATDLHE